MPLTQDQFLHFRYAFFLGFLTKRILALQFVSREVLEFCSSCEWTLLNISFFTLLQVEDPNLTGVSHLLVDEIHERGMNEDFLLIILHDLLPRRPDLRLILMSATINADLFSKYFGDAPTIHIPVLIFFFHLFPCSKAVYSSVH